MNNKNKLKQQVISKIKHGMTRADIKCIVEEILKERGLRQYNGEIILPGLRKGHFENKNRFTIYKTECEYIENKGLCIGFSKYGIEDAEMYFNIDFIENSSLTKEEEIDAKIWEEMNNGTFLSHDLY